MAVARLLVLAAAAAAAAVLPKRLLGVLPPGRWEENPPKLLRTEIDPGSLDVILVFLGNGNVGGDGGRGRNGYASVTSSLVMTGGLKKRDAK